MLSSAQLVYRGDPAIDKFNLPFELMSDSPMHASTNIKLEIFSVGRVWGGNRATKYGIQGFERRRSEGEL